MFILNDLNFVLLGLYLPEVLAEISGRPIVRLMGHTFIILVVVVLERVLWVYAMPSFPASWGRWQRARGRNPLSPTPCL